MILDKEYYFKLACENQDLLLAAESKIRRLEKEIEQLKHPQPKVFCDNCGCTDAYKFLHCKEKHCHN